MRLIKIYMNEKLDKYQGLIDLTLITDDVVKLGEEIDLLLKSLYQLEIDKFEQNLKGEVRLRVAMEIRKLLQGNIDQNKGEIKAILSSGYKAVCSLPVLKLILAFEPSEQVIADISNWARLNLEKGIILDLSMDRSVSGGAVIIYRGKFYDLTVKKKLQEIFEKGTFIL